MTLMPFWNEQLPNRHWTTGAPTLDGRQRLYLMEKARRRHSPQHRRLSEDTRRRRHMPASDLIAAQRTAQSEPALPQTEVDADLQRRKPPQRVTFEEATDRLLTVDDVARRLNVSRDWVWDHSSRKSPQLPVIRMGDGALRYRASRIEAFIDERERLSAMRRRA